MAVHEGITSERHESPCAQSNPGCALSIYIKWSWTLFIGVVAYWFVFCVFPLVCQVCVVSAVPSVQS
jgi:hypothetical protein